MTYLKSDVDDINEIDECEACESTDLARDADSPTHAVCLDCNHRQLMFTDE